MNDIEKLEKAIFDLHGCKCSHVFFQHIKEAFEGETVWEGDVGIFKLENHARATKVYAWSYKDEAGEEHYTAILGAPPVDSARAAVEVHILAQRQRAIT